MTQPTSLIVLGAAGRMGRMILECAGSAEEPYELAAALERPDHPMIGEPLRMMIPSAPPGMILTSEILAEVPAGSVVIDFTTPASTLAHLAWAESGRGPMVIGTTGLGEGWDIEITEMHHRMKKDAPSGTAAKLAEIALEATGRAREDLRHGREGIVGERPAREIGVHALRGGDVVGDHTVMFSTLGERLELTHRASTRETFARGALRAARWATAQTKPGLYSMQDVLQMK